MTICRACSSEIIGPDRYCRNCGALIVPSVTEGDDTYRFTPSARLATPSPAPAPASAPDATNPLYFSPLASPQGSALPYQSESLARKMLPGKPVLVVLILLCAIFLGVGIAIGSHAGRGQARWAEDRDVEQYAEQDAEAESSRRSYDEAVQNALGFMQGKYSAAEFPDAQGIFVNRLTSDDSPAALARIQAGDLLTELNNKTVRNDSELSEVIDSLKTGDEVPLKVYRDGAMVSSSIKIGDRHFPPLQTKMAPEDQGFLGILDSSRRCCIPGTKKWGVEVNELQANGSAEIFGLRPGDVITEFNGLPIKTPNEFNRFIRAVKHRTKIPLKFYRGNTEQKVEVILGHRLK
jgi:hypothetical protein